MNIHEIYLYNEYIVVVNGQLFIMSLTNSLLLYTIQNCNISIILIILILY